MPGKIFFFLIFFVLPPPPPHHFSNGPSLTSALKEGHHSRGVNDSLCGTCFFAEVRPLYVITLCCALGYEKRLERLLSVSKLKISKAKFLAFNLL